MTFKEDFKPSRVYNKLDWLPPPKVDRVNESDKDNKNDSKYNEDDKDDNNKNEDE